MSGECWIGIPGYLGKYAISTSGRIMSFISVRKNKNGDSTLAPSVSKGNEYPHVNLYTSTGKRKSFRVGRLVAESFIGPKPNGKELNHKDGIKANSKAGNLEWVTGSENMKHAVRIGLHTPWNKKI